MQFTLKTRQVVYDESSDKAVAQYGTIDCVLDTSLYAEERWERYFSKEAEKERLFDYIDRLLNSKGTVSANVYILSMLKAIYCFIESDKLPEFRDFIKLFDMSDNEYALEIINKLRHMFEIVLSTSATKN